MHALYSRSKNKHCAGRRADATRGKHVVTWTNFGERIQAELSSQIACMHEDSLMFSIRQGGHEIYRSQRRDSVRVQNDRSMFSSTRGVVQ